jgi:hypothetical protein
LATETFAREVIAFYVDKSTLVVAWVLIGQAFAHSLGVWWFLRFRHPRLVTIQQESFLGMNSMPNREKLLSGTDSRAPLGRY